MSYISIDEFEHWLKRAEKARAASKQLTDPCAKEQMLGIAESYQRRAHCDWRESHPTRPPTPVRMH
jgi:hypothetical protein